MPAAEEIVPPGRKNSASPKSAIFTSFKLYSVNLKNSNDNDNNNDEEEVIN